MAAEYSDAFFKISDFMFKWEGGLCNDAHDAGGITNYGVSIVFLKDFYKRYRQYCHAIGITREPDAQTIRSMSKSMARDIFFREFWEAPKYHLLPPAIAAAAFDSAVNCGALRANKLLQQGFNAVSPSKLSVDGILGPKSRAALDHDDARFVDAILDARASFYKSLATAKPTQKVFLKGWLNRTEDLRKFIKANFFSV